MDKFLRSFDKFWDLSMGKLVESKYTGFYFIVITLAYTAIVVTVTQIAG